MTPSHPVAAAASVPPRPPQGGGAPPGQESRSARPALTARETSTRGRLAAAVGPACLGAAWEAYHDARVAGLCHEGAWEVALGTRPSDGSAEADTLADLDTPRPSDFLIAPDRTRARP